MIFHNPDACCFFPDGSNESAAFSRTTDLCFAAHQDDVEIMAYGPIADCFADPDRWFSAVVLTDGAGSPRNGPYAGITDDQMKTVRAQEQKDAAVLGKYSALALLSYGSDTVKNPADDKIVEDIKNILLKCAPTTVYTHNLADKHETHVATALRVIAALRKIPEEKRPQRVYSLEVWRGLDWLRDCDKSIFDTSGHPNLAAALLGVFDSQIAGGKRYDLAALGRRCANATFFESHAVDKSDSVSFGLDITELVRNDNLSCEALIGGYIDRFKEEVIHRIGAMSK